MESNPNETNAQRSKFIEQNIDPNQQSSRSGPTPRELIAMKKESKKLEEESQLTFQPKFSAKPKDDGSKTSSSNSTLAGGSRFDKLYSEAMKRQQDNIEHPKAVANAEDLTFKPKISSRASSRSKRAPSPINVTDRLYSQSGAGRTSSKQLELPPPTFQPQISKRAISVERNKSKEISDRLYSLGKEHQEKLERMKQDYTNQKLQQECTFAPKINLNGTGSRSRSSSTSRPSFNGNNSNNNGNGNMISSESNSKTNITSGYISTNDVTNRLLNYEERRLAKLEEAKKQQLVLESQTVTFKPTVVLTKRASTPNRQPGETVFDKLSKQMLQKDILSPPPVTNADTMHKTSIASTGAGGDGKVFERLAAVSNDRQHMQAVLDKVKHDLELSGCTFQPQVNTSNVHNTAGSHTKPIHQRLDEETEKWKEDRKKREELKRQEELKGATFTPVIPARSAAIGHSNNGTNGGTIFDRLTSEAERIKENQEYRIEQRRLEEMKEATFSPTLPQKSLDLTSNRSPSRRAATPTNSAPTSPTHRTGTAATGAESFTSQPSAHYISAESSITHHQQQQQQHQSDSHSANTVTALATTPIALNKTSSHTTAASHITPKSVTSIPRTTTAKRTPASSTSSAFKESSGYSALTSSARGSFKGSLRNNNISSNNSITPVVTPSAASNTTNSQQSLSHTPVSAMNKRPTTTATTTTAPATVTPLTVNTSGAGVNLKRHVTDRTSPRTPNEVSAVVTVTSPAIASATVTATNSKSSKNGNTVSAATTGSAKGKTTSNTATVTSEKGANNNSSKNNTASNSNGNNRTNNNISPNRSIASTPADDNQSLLPIGIPTLRGQRKSIGNMQATTISTDVAATVEEEEDVVQVEDTNTDDTSSGINDTTNDISTANNNNNSDDPFGIFESAPVTAGTTGTDSNNNINQTVEAEANRSEVEPENNSSSTLENLVVVDVNDNEIAATTTATISTSDLLAGIEAYDDDDDEGSMSIVTEALPTARLDPDDTEYAVSSSSLSSKKQPSTFTIVETTTDEGENDDDNEQQLQEQQPLPNNDTTKTAVGERTATSGDLEEEFY